MVPEPTKTPVPTATPVPTPSVLTPTETPELTSPAPTSTPVPTQSLEPECRKNFVLRNGECICDGANFVLRGGNCYHKCGEEKISPDDICVCSDGYEKNDFGNCSKKCTIKHTHLSKFGECECDENFIEKDGKCICDEKESDLIGDKCLLKPGEHEERIINGDNVKYSCKPGYDYDINRFCQKKEDGSINKKQSVWQRFLAKKPEQCYDKEGGYWFSRYENGTALCRRSSRVWNCPDESCKKINKRNKK